MDTPSNIELQSLVSVSETTMRTNENLEAPHQKSTLSSTLKEQSPSWFWRIGLPGTLIIIPLAYIVLNGIVASLNNTKETSFGNDILEILQVASTLWPISFAAILGPFLKTLALYRAEKGSTLGTLEFLLTSQTTAAAIKNLFVLQGTHIWTIAIVVVWCLSPLGGQAAVRSMSLQPNSTSFHTPAVYYLGGNISNLNGFYSGKGDMGLFAGGILREELVTGFRTNILASFSRPDVLVSNANGSSEYFNEAVESLGGQWSAARLGQSDLWGNVRVPFVELLPQYNPKRPMAWVTVPSDRVVAYSSLMGMPIRRGTSSRVANSTVLVQTYYQTASCGAAFNGSSWLTPTSQKLYYHNLSNPSYILETPFLQPQQRASPNIFLDLVNNTKTVKEHLSSTFYSENSTEPSTKLDLIIGGFCGMDMFLRTCELSTSYVDVEVGCVRSNSFEEMTCQANRIRHTPGFPIAGNLTALSNFFALRGVVYEFAWSTANYSPVQASPIEAYLKDPPIALNVTYKPVNPGCFPDVPRAAFEARFATALNTVITASYNPTVWTSGDGISLKNRNIMWQNTTIAWTELINNVYVIQEQWFSLWLASTLALLISAIGNIIIRVVIKAPDFLDSVAGLTRDSKFVDVCEEGSGESSSDRLKKLKNLTVRICDVQSEAETGRIALTTTIGGKELKWERSYE